MVMTAPLRALLPRSPPTAVSYTHLMAVTPLETLLEMAPTQPEELALSGWRPGTEISVRVKKPNFYTLLANNAIPNPLLPEMQKLFVRRQVAEEHAKGTQDFAKALIHIAKACLVEPSYAQLEEEMCIRDSQTSGHISAAQSPRWPP